MALIKCPECDKQVSDKAAACPACAYPLRDQPRKPPIGARQPVHTIEQTGKKWKKTIFTSALLALAGFVLMLLGLAAPGGGGLAPIALGLVMFLVAIVMFGYAKVMVWWHHD